jgi:hypothetical protein
METYNITMDDEQLAVRPEVLLRIYGAIEAQAKEGAPADVRHEVRISQDARIKTRFYIAVSDRMAPHLIMAIQKQAEQSPGLKPYLYKLQEQLMAQTFAGAKDGFTVSFG